MFYCSKMVCFVTFSHFQFSDELASLQQDDIIYDRKKLYNEGANAFKLVAA